ncbi:MAG: BamA/TamA family outer membrane protein [Muribaculaceae bacterium]|nr:BamA/TamA family outer membrane protein [Muribaculaceae bacterium]
MRYSDLLPLLLFITSLIALPQDIAAEGMHTDSANVSKTFYVEPMPEKKHNTKTEYADSISMLQKTPKWLREYLNSLMRGNIDRTRDKRIDMSFAATPSYTREAGFGIGAAATGLYRIDRNDTLPNPSDFFISLNASFNKFYVLTFKGNNLFPDNRSRLSYKLELYRKNLDFWGINSEETARNAKSKYNRRQIDLQAEYIYRVNRRFYTGFQIRSNYTDARDVRNPEYLLNERSQYYVTGVGLSFEYDTRDNLVTPTRGVHLAYKPMVFPKGLGSAPSTFYSHTLIANSYIRLWKGAILALDWYAKLNSERTPWTMREMLASDGIRMRGYYMGSTMDNSQIASQAELRQHLWKRLGIVIWGGGATVFSSIKDLHKYDIKPEWLHNFGVGLRFEFKHNVNARIDYGFGQGTSGIVFAIGEAF